MPITPQEHIIYAYNQNEQKLVLVSQETNDDFFYSVGGWFGKKLYEILNARKELDQVLESDFKDQDELKRIFLRFLLTLSEKNILSSLPIEQFSHLNAFSDKESQEFGSGDFIGNIITTEINIGEELLATAQLTCPPGTVYVDDPFFPACVPMGT